VFDDAKVEDGGVAGPGTLVIIENEPGADGMVWVSAEQAAVKVKWLDSSSRAFFQVHVDDLLPL
jgi:hypothetical protein